MAILAESRIRATIPRQQPAVEVEIEPRFRVTREPRAGFSYSTRCATIPNFYVSTKLLQILRVFLGSADSQIPAICEVICIGGKAR